MNFITLKEGGVYMRNLEEDLKICNNASPGPWEWWDSFGRISEDTTWTGVDLPPCELLWERQGCEVITAVELQNMSDEELDAETIIAGIDDDGKPDNNAGLFIRKADAEFIAKARIGWPESIRRALDAEEQLAKLVTESSKNLFCPLWRGKCKDDECYFFTKENACLIYDGLSALIGSCNVSEMQSMVNNKKGGE